MSAQRLSAGQYKYRGRYLFLATIRGRVDAWWVLSTAPGAGNGMAAPTKRAAMLAIDAWANDEPGEVLG